MGFKKFDGSAWQPITPKKLKGIPYTGTLPAVLSDTKAGYLHRYKIYGNTEQTGGTPTPENPIVPSECGERTENLFNKNATDTTNGYIDGKYIRQSDGAMISDTGYAISEYMEVTENTTYCWTFSLTNTSKHSAPTVEYLDETKTRLSVATHSNIITQFNFTTPANCKYVRASVYKPSISEAMLTEGSTAPSSYIPYGYKLPLTSAGQNVDIYLGESQTTRQIGKFDLSQATWSLTGAAGLFKTTDIPNVKYTSSNLELGNGLAEKYQIHTGSGMSTSVNCIAIDTAQVSVNTGSNSIKPTGIFYYALATPETSVVNEPLRKIGNYADTIDSTQTSAQIPTSAGSTTISWAGEGLAPSEFDSIQEWVDTPTYTYTNGEWVADN